jgi:hypothetical protein
MLDRKSPFPNTKLVPQENKAAIKEMEKLSVLMERISVIKRHMDGGKNVTNAIPDAADELDLDAETLWKDWKNWKKRLSNSQ